MPDATLKSFLNLLKKSQLLNNDQLALAESLARGSERVGGQNSQPAAGNEAAVNSRSAAGLNTPELLAAELVRRKMLTSWQRSQLLQGQSGFVLQQYRLQKPIGRGGMGHVFQALDTNTRAIVAIKVMAKKLTANQTLVNRFRREIKATSRLNCPHIVRTLDGGRVGDIDFMVMEFVNGDQLDDVTRRIPELPVGIACDIIRQAALGLQHAHEQKMVHRDIKPANLIIAWSDKGDGTVKLMDMGLVRLSEESTTDTTSAERAATRAGQVMGTPDYMSPEQAWDTATADIRSDIYSLGCSFFRMLTGRIPFPGDNPLQVLMNRCSKDAPSARSLRSDLPEEINAICQRMTLRDPDARFQTPAEVAAALEPFCEPLTVDALRKAARTAKAEDLLPLEPSKDSADEKETSFAQDASYQQFLKEMESGAAVDLLNSRSAQADGLPELSIEAAMANTVPDFRRPTSPVLTQRKQNRAAFRPGLIAAIASAVVLLPVGYILLSPDPQTSRNDVPVNGLVDVENKGQAKEANVDLPAARFASPDPVEVKAGDVVTFSPELSITRPANRGVLFYRLGPEAPTAATIDAETGDVTWQTTVLQKPVRYQIPIQLVYDDASTTPPVTNSDAGNIIADCTLEVAVTRESSRFALPILPPQRMPIGESSQISFATKSELPPEAEPEYQVIRGLMPGMQLDSVNGILRWNPAKRQIGRHVLTVQLTDKASDQILATTVYEIRVVPTVFSIQLIEPTTRSIAAGQTLQLNLVDASGMRLLRGVRLKTDPDSPPGVVIDPGTGVLSWDVPKDVSGKQVIRVSAEPLLPDVEFATDARTETSIVVDVQGSSTPDATQMTDARPPDPDEVAAAAKELEEVYKREVSQARTPAARSELARTLFLVSADKPASATDYALLNLAEELASRAKAADIILDVRQLRHRRYGVSELEELEPLFRTFSKSALNQLQQDVVVEHTVRLCRNAATAGDWASIDHMVSFAKSLLKNADGVAEQLNDDLNTVADLASQLKSAGTGSLDPASPDALRRDALIQKLDRWQFEPLFSDLEKLSFFQARNTANPLPQNGKPQWKLQDGRLTFDASSQDGAAGLIDVQREVDRYVVRFEMSVETTSLQFIFGASRDQNLSAFTLILDATAPGQVQRVSGGTVIARPGVSVPASGFTRRRVEIMVDKSSVLARMDGVVITNTQIADLNAGRIGLLVALQQQSSLPRLQIHDARILVLPAPAN